MISSSALTLAIDGVNGGQKIVGDAGGERTFFGSFVQPAFSGTIERIGKAGGTIIDSVGDAAGEALDFLLPSYLERALGLNSPDPEASLAVKTGADAQGQPVPTVAPKEASDLGPLVWVAGGVLAVGVLYMALNK